MHCPKCGHMRAATATNPAWQCPACGIAYHKYAQRLRQKATQSLRPLTAADPTPKPIADGSVWTLVVANLVTLGMALAFSWDLYELMFIYWLQSVIIGASYVARILSLERFSTENFRINDKPVEPTPETKRQTAFFFCVHYGIFHVAYLAFILEGAPAGLPMDLGLAICIAIFAANHAYSYRYHRDMDRRGTPNIGTLMFTPYLRIVPMHLTIVAGSAFSAGLSLLFFGMLKTVADALMHVVEHRRLGHAERTGEVEC